MKKKPLRWLLIFASFLTVMCIALILFGDILLLYTFPTVVLSSEIRNVASQLENRFEYSPLHCVSEILNPEGEYTVTAEIHVPNAVLGTVHYDMRTETDFSNNRIYTSGEVTSSVDRSMNLSIFCDSDFLAVASDHLNHEQFYGITYNSFREDIQNIPLLDYVVSTSMLETWDQSIKKIQEQINKDYTIPSIPQWSAEDIQKLALGMITYPRNIEKRTIQVNSEVLECFAVIYTLDGQQINHMFGGTDYAKDDLVSVTFFLHDMKMVKITASCKIRNQEKFFYITLGPNPSKNDLVFSMEASSEEPVLTVQLKTKNTENLYSETWNIQKNHETRVYCLTQEKLTSKMTLTAGEQCAVFSLVNIEDGIQIASDDLKPLWNILTGAKTEASVYNAIPGTIQIAEGADITTPEYKNLDQWTLEDFFILLESVGSLVGIHIGI